MRFVQRISNPIIKRTFFISLIALFLMTFSSCYQDNEFGVDVLPGSDKLKVAYFDSLSIEAFTELDDTLVTDNFSMALLGSYIDPIFGSTNAGFVTQLRLGAIPNWDKNTIADSMVLILPVDTLTGKLTNYYGKLEVEQQINVFRLLEKVEYQSTSNSVRYYENSSFNHQTNPIGQLQYTATSNDSVIRIPLNKELARELIDSAVNHQGYILKNDSLQLFFKGIYVTTGNQVKEAAIININLFREASLLKIYYRNDTTKKEYSMAIDQYTGRAQLFKHDYSTARFKDQLYSTSKKQDSVVYIQAMAGVRAKIKIPSLDKIFKSNQKIVINKADLMIKIADDPTRSGYAVPGSLALRGVGISGKEEQLKDYIKSSDGSYSYLAESYDTNNKWYQFQIPFYLQSIIDGKKPNTGFFLTAGSRVSSPNRVILKSGLKKGGISLKITYSEL